MYDYKLFCFNGKVKYIQVDLDRFTNHTRCIYDTNWKKQEFKTHSFYGLYLGDIKKPKNLDLMIELSNKLSLKFCHVRVDFYEIGSKMFIFNVLGNILIFVPFGYFVSRYIKAKNVWQIILLSIITSVTVETVQLRIGRSFDIDDIFLNLIGGIIGYFLFISLDAIINHLPKFLQKDFFYSLICLIILICFLVYFFHICGLWGF